MESLIRDRATAPTDLIVADPAKALEPALPERTVRDLTAAHPQLTANLETRGRWEGFLETLT